MTTLWEIGRAPVRRTPVARPGRDPALAEVVVVSDAVHGVQDAVRRARPEDLLEPLVLAAPEARRAATAESPILSAFLMTSAWAERLADGLSPSERRRVRLQAGLAGLVLQVDGVRLELAVRLRQVLHPQRATHELVQIAGVGLCAAQQGHSLVSAAAGGCAHQQLSELVHASRPQTDLVRTLNLMLVENLPDERLDG